VPQLSADPLGGGNTNGKFMNNKKTFLLVLIILGFIVGKYAWDKLFTNSEIVSFEDSDWSPKNILGVRFESPFELSETEINNSTRDIVKERRKYKYATESISLFIEFAEYKEGIPLDLDGSANETVQAFKARKEVSDFIYEVKPINRNSLNGRLIQGTFKWNGRELEFSNEWYKKDLKLLSISCQNMNHEENREVRERIMKSINITL